MRTRGLTGISLMEEQSASGEQLGPGEKASADAEGTAAVQVVEKASRLAQSVQRAATIYTAVVGVAGAACWSLLWDGAISLLLPGSAFSVWAVAGLVLLLAPAGVLGLFVAGLHELVALPDRVRAQMQRGAAASQSAYTATRESIRPAEDDAAPDIRSSRRGVWRIAGRLVRVGWRLWTFVQESRGLLLHYGALLRLLTPGFLLLVAAAALVGSLLVLLAGVGSLVALIV